IITVAAEALMRRMRAMLTLTLIGAPSAATTGAGARLDVSDRPIARTAANMGRMGIVPAVLKATPYFHGEWFTIGKRDGVRVIVQNVVILLVCRVNSTSGLYSSSL